MRDWDFNSDRTIAVSTTFAWRPIDTCPTLTKCLLLTGGGVAIVGHFNNQDFYTHWAPLPRHALATESNIFRFKEQLDIYDAFKEDPT